MNLTLREKLRISSVATDEELKSACNKHYLIYKNVFDNSSDMQVRELAQKKIDDLIASANAENITIDINSNYNKSETKSVHPYNIETELCTTERPLTSNIDKIKKDIELLPESAKKYYLQAVLTYSTEPKTVETTEKFVKYIANARQLDPSNFVYQQILNDSNSAITVYQQHYDIWHQEQQEKMKREENRIIAGKVAKGVGGVILAILGGILAILGTCLGAICEGCGDC